VRDAVVTEAPTYFDDAPADPPGFDFDVVASALANLLVERSDGATVVGVHGPWGCGKSTLLFAIRDELEARLHDHAPVIVEFNAWKFHEREALWRALILHLVGELRPYAKDAAALDELEASLYRAFEVTEAGPWSVNWRTVGVELASVALAVFQLDAVGRLLRGSSGFLRGVFGRRKADDTAGVIDDKDIERIGGILERTTVSRHVDQVQSIEQFLAKFRTVVEGLSEGRRRVFVFVDDLDRCLPEAALEIFEAIKLFLDAPGCGFVVAVDRDVIRRGLFVRYKTAAPEALLVDPDEYIEKTIAVSFDVPRLSAPDIQSLIDAAHLPLELTAAHRKLLLRGLARNPRRVKRFMNLLRVQLDLAAIAHERGRRVPDCFLPDADPEGLATLLKVLLISYRYSGIARAGLNDPRLLVRLQGVSNAYVRALADKAQDAKGGRAARLASEAAIVQALHQDEAFWELMAERPNFADDEARLALLVDWFRQSATAEAALVGPGG
jgi:KAP family P-loop domain